VNVDSQKTAPLRLWNDLERENAENAIVAAMFDAGSQANEPIDKESTWLLAGTLAVAAFAITNAEKVIPMVGKPGFTVLGAMLCLSCFFGLTAKYYAVRCKIARSVGAAVKKEADAIFSRHALAQAKVEENARFWGIELETNLRLHRILSEFMDPLPSFFRRIVRRTVAELPRTPQAAYRPTLALLHRQVLFTALQTASFFCFVVLGFISAFLMPAV
jgi:hypothetical protein